jgi:hypothetical protein
MNNKFENSEETPNFPVKIQIPKSDPGMENLNRCIAIKAIKAAVPTSSHTTNKHRRQRITSMITLNSLSCCL